MTHIDTALAEAARVLRPGGRFFCLEFGQVGNPYLARGHDIYSRYVIPKIGALVAQDEDSYQYLIETFVKFRRRSTFAAGWKSRLFAGALYGATGGLSISGEGRIAIKIYAQVICLYGMITFIRPLFILLPVLLC